MGWTSVCTDLTPAGFFRQEFTSFAGEKLHTTIDDMAVKFGTAYIALRRHDGDGRSRCMGVVVRWRRRSYAICYKDMCETEGPTEDDCPERILRKLSPLSHIAEHGTNGRRWAAGWRERCWEKINRRRRKVESGAILKFAQPLFYLLRSSDAERRRYRVQFDTFELVKRGRRFCFRPVLDVLQASSLASLSVPLVRITNWRVRDYVILPPAPKLEPVILSAAPRVRRLLLPDHPDEVL